MSEGIIISESETHGFFLPIFLAQRLKLEGIDVLLSPIAWPRDNLIIYSDGSYEDLSKDKFSKILSPHFAWHGGTFIKGDDFIIASSVEKDENKRDETHKRLGVSKGYYFDISDCLDSLKDLMILKNGKSFYGSDFLHIDSIFNLYNSQKKLITYQ